MNPTQSISAIQYERIVYPDESSFHRDQVAEVIMEVYIPSHHVIFNSKGNIFKSDESLVETPESKKTEKNIRLNVEFVEKISQVAKLRFEMENKKEAIQKDIMNIFKSQ